MHFCTMYRDLDFVNNDELMTGRRQAKDGLPATQIWSGEGL
jgi:hypothetical protein